MPRRAVGCMRWTTILGLAALCLWGAPDVAAAVTIDFDSVSSGTPITTQFATDGVVFTNLTARNDTFGGVVIVPSPPNYVSPSVRADSIIEFVDPTDSSTPATTDLFSFDNAGLVNSGGFYNGIDVSIRDLLGNEIGSATIPPAGPSESRPIFTTSFSLAGIHEVVLSYTQNRTGGIAPFDNVTFNAVTPAAPVPAPATVLLVLTGVVAVGIRGWRQWPRG